MIPMEAGSHEEVVRGTGRDTLFPGGYTRAATRGLLPRRSTRLVASGGGFKGVKRTSRALRLPSGRKMLQMMVAERSRTRLHAEEETSSPIARSKVDLRSSTLATESDDAVVPRCTWMGQEETITSPTSATSVIPSAPVAPKDANRTCSYHHHQQQHHPHHRLLQDQEHLSPGCQTYLASSEGTLLGRVPSNPRLINIPIHDDPRQWSRLDVRTWLDHVRRVYNIQDLDLDRFPMNGKALCIMSKDMFVYRVPHGGIPLYLDFQLRFRRALGIR